MWKTTLLLLLFGVYPRACHSAGCGEGVQQGPDSKIVGGRDAGEGEFPWQASLQRKSKLGYFHVCGASLVSPTWLVTAAHCIRLNYTNSYRITIGTNNLSEVTADEIYSIRMIVVKQGFDIHTFHNDIALVQLFRPVPDFISPVCLAPHAPKRNASLVVTGWGTTSDGGRPSYYLQAADVLSIPREDCFEYYEDLTESMTCAGLEEGEKDACQGDSGGPLVQWQNGIAYQVGIVSWGAGCAEPRQPGVYTDVPQFVPWIYHYIDPEEEE